MVFVSGASGLLGAHLLSELLAHGEQIIALYRDEQHKMDAEKTIKFYHPNNFEKLLLNIQWEKGDVLDVVLLENLMKSCDKVYHCAAIVSFLKKDYSQMMKINKEGTFNMVNCALATGVKKFIHVSSTAAIGKNCDKEYLDETCTWKSGDDISGYSITKYSAELEVWRGIEEGLNAVIVNPTMIIGAGNWNQSSMTIFKTIDKGLKFITDGVNSFVDARDVSKIMFLLAESEIQNERYLLIGENISFKAAFSKIAVKLNKRIPDKMVSKWMAQAAWRISAFLSFFTGAKPVISKETVRSSFGKTYYSAEKIKKELSFEFRNMDEMIDNAIKGRIV